MLLGIASLLANPRYTAKLPDHLQIRCAAGIAGLCAQQTPHYPRPLERNLKKGNGLRLYRGRFRLDIKEEFHRKGG